jgi:type III pantothenate kinase
MMLALDVRNDRILAGFRTGDAWKTVIRLGVDRSADELSFLLESCVRRIGLAEGDMDAAWISSVVPALTPRVMQAVSSTFGLAASVVGPGIRTGIKIRIDSPSELGSDIVCAAVAARSLVQGASIVVDFGTAIVLSAMNSGGELLGVSIAPGLQTAAHALRASTAQIPEVRLDIPRRVIGRNTAQSVQSGIYLGYGGLVRHLAELMSDEMGEAATVLGTGDEEGHAIMQSVGYDAFHPFLVLDGLALIGG